MDSVHPENYVWLCVNANENEQSCYKFDCFIIFTIKNTTRGWSDELQDTVSNNIEIPGSSNFMVKNVIGFNWSHGSVCKFL